MIYPALPDPIAAIRGMISREAGVLLDRVLTGAAEAAGAAVRAARRNLFQRADDLTTLIGQVPHKAAEAIVDLDRGFHARRLTADAGHVTKPYGAR